MWGDVFDWARSRTYEEWVLILGATGQTAFVVLWAAMPWYREWVGRALMIKAASIMLLFDTSLAYWIWPNLVNTNLSRIVYGLVVIGIWSQFSALIYEKWRATQADRSVTGTHHRGD